MGEKKKGPGEAVLNGKKRLDLSGRIQNAVRRAGASEREGGVWVGKARTGGDAGEERRSGGGKRTLTFCGKGAAKSARPAGVYDHPRRRLIEGNLLTDERSENRRISTQTNCLMKEKGGESKQLSCIVIIQSRQRAAVGKG